MLGGTWWYYNLDTGEYEDSHTSSLGESAIIGAIIEEVKQGIDSDKNLLLDTYLKKTIDEKFEAVNETTTGLSQSISNESSARELADTQEKTDREQGDATLQSQIDGLKARGVIEGERDTYADLLMVDTTNMLVNTLYIVEEDETHEGLTTMYSWDGTQWVYAGRFNVNMKASLVSFTPTDGILSTDVQAAIQEVSGKAVKLKSADTQIIQSNVAIGKGKALLGIDEDNTQHIIGAIKTYNPGTPEQFTQNEIGNDTNPTNINSAKRPTVETPQGKEEIAYVRDIAEAGAGNVFVTNLTSLVSGKLYMYTPTGSSGQGVFTEYTGQGINEAISVHNTDSTAHQDIRNKVSDVEAIARGKSRARVFDTVADLDTWLSIPANVTQLQVGDNFYIREMAVPDYWWDGTAKQPLETEKVDLSGYAKADGSNATGTWPISITGNATTAGTAEVSNRTKKEHSSAVLTVANWVASGAEWKYTITDELITDGSEVTFAPNRATTEIYSTAGIYPDADAVVGEFVLYAKTKPTADITLLYTIIY